MHATHRRAQRGFQMPYWLLAAILLAVLIMWNIVADQGYQTIFWALMRGVTTTIYVTVIAFTLAVILGLIMAVLRLSPIRLVRECATFYIEIVRGIPMLVLLFYIAFVGAPWFVDFFNTVTGPLQETGLMGEMTVRMFDFTWRAIIALTISYSAFLAEIFRAGIEAVDRGQVEAARALGLRRKHIFRFIIAPQALRLILPPLGNELVAMIKDSALVSALGVQDITQLGKVYSASTFKFFETYNVVAFLYLVMTISLTLVVRWFERMFDQSHRDTTN
ncbi:L-cystine transport system permease protein TcyB [Maritalea myrionectae]|uniref:L-cystine transport system permease protein TcyB n=1 Tax=Maritalea myrionectae TaxID=454601 RepID=A0A2R4MIH2_9HYPH|nr:amino acid ABC transporter permease [Maritalea myrionectae]AVX05817.1 L-cystine transport system permease protein TcyB [Maritalea myrionectae]